MSVLIFMIVVFVLLFGIIRMTRKKDPKVTPAEVSQILKAQKAMDFRQLAIDLIIWRWSQPDELETTDAVILDQLDFLLAGYGVRLYDTGMESVTATIIRTNFKIHLPSDPERYVSREFFEESVRHDTHGIPYLIDTLTLVFANNTFAER